MVAFNSKALKDNVPFHDSNSSQTINCKKAGWNVEACRTGVGNVDPGGHSPAEFSSNPENT